MVCLRRWIGCEVTAGPRVQRWARIWWIRDVLHGQRTGAEKRRGDSVRIFLPSFFSNFVSYFVMHLSDTTPSWSARLVSLWFSELWFYYNITVVAWVTQPKPLLVWMCQHQGSPKSSPDRVVMESRSRSSLYFSFNISATSNELILLRTTPE